MNCVFLGRVIPTELEEDVKNLSVDNMQDAANALQWHLYDGLCENINEGIHMINVLPIGSFPQYYKKMFIKQCNFRTKYSDGNVNIGFLNFKFFRNFFYTHKIVKALSSWCEQSVDNRIVFIYSLFLPFLKAAKEVKKQFHDLKVCAIVADLPNMSNLSSRKNILLKLFEKNQTAVTYNSLDCVDGYVLLTKYMADYMKLDKPFCVVEGIATEFSACKKEWNADESIKTILYSGTLHRRFGVLSLLEAFKLIGDENYRLIICGVGDSENAIKQAAKVDKRIVFKGQLSRNEVLKLQSDATVLVNPRQNNEVFTKYSFPSKTMEYLSSGTPVVAYKLDGIPDDYDEFINYVPDNEISTLAGVIIKVCEMPKEKRKLFGDKAQNFVLMKKNYIAQTKNILDFLDSAHFI